MKDEGIRFVLLVEDEAIIALQEKIALEAEGYSVIISSDGEDAVNKACNCGYDLSIILMDIDLGGVMDGPEAARRILSVKEIPIIFLSSHTEKDIVERTEEIMSYGYVVKNSGMIVLNASIKMAWKLFCEKKLVNESHSKIEKMNSDLEAANNEKIKWRSENKIHTDELIESERRFRSIVEGAPDPIFIQTDMKFTFLNEAAVRIFGSKSESELLGRNVFERFHPDYHQKIIERIGRLNKEESSVREFLELRFLRLDGTEVWVETVGEPINYDGKKGAIVFARETGLRKQAEKAIYNGKAHFDSLFENNHAVMMLIDPSSGEIYDVNPAAERFYGWNRNEMRLKKISDINTLSLEEVKTEMNKALSLKLNHFKFRHRQKEGVVRDVEVYSGPITVDGKNLLYSIVYDITDRLQAE